MPICQVEITRVAESDIQEIFQYIADDNESAAIKLVDEIEKQISSSEQFPLRCPIIPESRKLGIEYRHIIYGNYRTICRIEETRAIILRVIHSARLLSLEILQK